MCSLIEDSLSPEKLQINPFFCFVEVCVLEAPVHAIEILKRSRYESLTEIEDRTRALTQQP